MSSANLPIKERGEYSLTADGTTFKSITETVCRVTENKAPRGWWIAFLPAASFTGVLGLALRYLVRRLHAADPHRDGALAPGQVAAHLGRLRGQHVLHGLDAVLVRRPHPGLR